MVYISPMLSAMCSAAKKASVALTRDFNELEHLQNSVHKDNMFAVRSYEKVEKTIKEELGKFKPDYAVICKKADEIPANSPYFVLSPIDGFANFAHGNASFAISLALIENNGVVDAVVYSPISDEMFFAEKGCGAFKEGFRSHERLRVAGTKDTEKAVISCSSQADLLQKVLSLSSNLLVTGSASLDLAHLAAGKSDVAVLSNVSVMNLAAGLLLVKESGGYVVELGETDVRSENLEKVLAKGGLIASNENLRQKVANTMAK